MTVRSPAPIDIANLQAPGEEDDEAPRLEFTPRRLAAFALFVFLAVVALYFLLPRLSGLEDTWHRIEEGHPAWLGLALLFAVGMFGGYVFLFQAVFVHGALRLSWRESYQITMASLAASRVFSAGGAGGVVLQAWALRRAGLGARTVADRTVSFIVITYLVYMLALILCGYGLHFGLLPGSAPFAITWVPATLALVVTVVGLSIGFVPPDLSRRVADWASRRSSRRWIAGVAHVPATISAGERDALRRIVRRDRAVLGAVLYWAFQILALWACFRAFGESPAAAVIVMGFFVGMLGNLLPLPGGIGGVDGGMIGAFAAFGVDFGLATVAVLVYRGFTFWLPTLPGVAAYVQLRRTVERWREERRGAAAATA